MDTQQLAYSIDEAAAEARQCRSIIYKAIGRGELVARKRGRRTIILRDDLAAWLQGLPKVVKLEPVGARKVADAEPADAA